MAGIDAIKLEEFIKKNENIYGSVDINRERVIAALKNLDDSYDGRALNNIFSVLCSQDSTFDNILPVLESYILLLKSVRKNYVLQDISLSQHISKM